MQKVAKKSSKNRVPPNPVYHRKDFQYQEKFNLQNDHVYAKSCSEAKDKISRTQRGHHLGPRW